MLTVLILVTNTQSPFQIGIQSTTQSCYSLLRAHPACRVRPSLSILPSPLSVPLTPSILSTRSYQKLRSFYVEPRHLANRRQHSFNVDVEVAIENFRDGSDEIRGF